MSAPNPINRQFQSEFPNQQPHLQATPQSKQSGDWAKQASDRDRQIPKNNLTDTNQRQSTAQTPKKRIKWQLSPQTIGILASAAIMLPILTIGTATYWVGTRALKQQTTITKRLDFNGLGQAELIRQQRLLSILLIGTGTTALVGGIAAILLTKRFLAASKSLNPLAGNTHPTAAPTQGELFKSFDASTDQAAVLEEIVESARTALGGDRVLIYSLDQERLRVVAESVALGWPKIIGKTIQSSSLSDKLEQYRHGQSDVIDCLQTSNLTQPDLEQLEIQVKACVVTPILERGQLLGLLAVHQCAAPRHWEVDEISLLKEFAQKASLIIDRAKVLQNLTRLQIQAQKSQQLSVSFEQMIAQMRQSVQAEEVFKISVEQVRQVLQCDRALIYRIESDHSGLVVAESVGPGWTRVLGQKIQNPIEVRGTPEFNSGSLQIGGDIGFGPRNFLGGNSREKVGFTAERIPSACAMGRSPAKQQYSDGEVRAIDRLETPNSLEVKAYLIAPIFSEGKLFGALVAHQCAGARHWQSDETHWLAQIAPQVGFALDRVKLLRQSDAKTHRGVTQRKWNAHFAQIMQSLHQSQPEEALETSVEQIRRILGCDRVLIYRLDTPQSGVVLAESVTLGTTRTLGKTISNPITTEDLPAGGVQAINHIALSDLFQSQREHQRLGVKASLVTPILDGGQLFGFLIAHQCDQPRVWQESEIHWFEQIATPIAFALDRAKLLQKLQQQQLPVEALNSFTRRLGDRYLDQTQLLNVAVEQVRQMMALERVMIYQFGAESDAAIVAESVAPGYPKVLGSPVEPPGLVEYTHSRQGRVNAIDDVEKADLDSHAIAQLQAFGVKASIIVPIVQEHQQYALLIGHQCQQPRTWQRPEVDLFAQLALQIELALNQIRLKQQLNNSSVAQQQQLSQLLAENQAALQELKNQIDRHASAAQNFFPPIPSITGQPEPKVTFEPTKIIQPADRSIVEIEADQIEDSIVAPVEFVSSESNLNRSSIKPIAPMPANLTPNNQFASEIADLSRQISQQSLAVNYSFKRVVELAHQLSADTELNSEEQNQP